MWWEADSGLRIHAVIQCTCIMLIVSAFPCMCELVEEAGDGRKMW